jgi:hypothetical protein
VLGNSRNHVNLDWVGGRGMERRLATDVFQRFFDGQPAKYRPAENPQNFLFQQISAVTQPTDVQGTVGAHPPIPRSGEARPGLELRAGTQARARGVAGQPLRRLPRLASSCASTSRTGAVRTARSTTGRATS